MKVAFLLVLGAIISLIGGTLFFTLESPHPVWAAGPTATANIDTFVVVDAADCKLTVTVTWTANKFEKKNGHLVVTLETGAVVQSISRAKISGSGATVTVGFTGLPSGNYTAFAQVFTAKGKDGMFPSRELAIDNKGPRTCTVGM